jgi:hypothetical protein
MDFYNGYSPAERSRAGAAARREVVKGGLSPAMACMLCGDPSAHVELHSEDYSRPYCFEPPAAYWLCIPCHRNNLHKRFSDPSRWTAFLLHVERGGYASDLHQPHIRREVQHATAALRAGEAIALPQLRTRDQRDPWWRRLSLDERTKTDPAARPRP